MDITTEYLEAIRRVLNTEVTLREVATDYSPPLKTMVGIAILQGANVQDEDLVKPRGMYGRLLQELTITPGVPVDGWPEGDGFLIWPTWYEEVSRNTLVGRARNYGFHETKHRQGHGLTFIGHPAFQRLLHEDESFTKTCRMLYDKARKAIIERRIEEAARRKIQQRLHAKELRQRPKLREEFSAILVRWERMINNPHTASFSGVKGLTLELNKLLERYDPEN